MILSLLLFPLLSGRIPPGALANVDDKAKPRILTAEDLKPLNWRSVGPANMGGRVADIVYAPDDSRTFYVGFGTSGIWKTTNRGTTFSPVFDSEKTSSIGSIVVANAPIDWPGWKDDTETEATKRAEKGKGKIIWVGTGEGNGRNSSSWGAGVYRSTNAGSSWTNVGLEDAGDIPRLAVDAKRPDVCYAAVLGRLWGPNKTRGIYKTSDGGKTWNPSLKIDDSTGAIDVLLDPKNPETVYAAMYARRRTPFSYSSGGPKGGIFRSQNGGKTWEQLTHGLPAQTGRIGLDIFASNPKVLIAVVESDEDGPGSLFDPKSHQGGLFRTEDGGDTWKRVNAMTPRSFYFSKVRIDPKDDQRIYMLGFDIWASTNGGKTFETGLTDKIHTDWHACAIDPADPEHIVIGCDAGVFQTVDQGKSWDFLNLMAVGEFYNVAVDNSKPYRIMGGLQDNGSWLGKSATRLDGITLHDWDSVGGGDGFHVAFDPADPNVVYTESQGGGIVRIDTAEGIFKSIQPSPKEGQASLRFNWNAPFFVSPHDPTVLYMGGNRVLKLTDRGSKWKPISDDLTTNDPNKNNTSGSNAETYCTIVSLAESPITKGLLWAGSDDGLIHVSENDGTSWAAVNPKAVNGFYVASLEPSHVNAKTCYAAIDGHRSDNNSPLILVTDDQGRNWKNITGDLPVGDSIRVVKEDLKNQNVLYAGNETGIYITADRGIHWVKLNNGSLPTVGVHDIAQHSRDFDLIAATHGRSIWVLDDAFALSQLTQERMEKPLHLFESLPARPQQRSSIDGMWGDRFYRAANSPTGANITYWLKDGGAGVSIKIEDSKGKTVTTLTGTSAKGMNRTTWDMQPESKRRLPNRGEEGSIYVPPGKYKVTATFGKFVETNTLTVLPYPYNDGLSIPPGRTKNLPDEHK